jgi:TolB-like protein
MLSLANRLPARATNSISAFSPLPVVAATSWATASTLQRAWKVSLIRVAFVYLRTHYRQVRDRVTKAFLDLGERQLNARPVRVYAVNTGAAGPAPTPHASAPEKPSAPRLSIVVLPFANLGGDPEQEYFVDGVTESLTTDLPRISGSFVIGRNTAFTYKGKHVDLKQVGRELNVRYVLEGSVQRSGNQLRVAAQLIDAGSGAHLWAERFDRRLVDLFEVQDEIVARLANQLGTQLITAEARRAEHAPHPDSMDLYFQGMACLSRGWSPGHMTQARGFFERALARDPSNIDALVGTAGVDTVRGTIFLLTIKLHCLR